MFSRQSVGDPPLKHSDAPAIIDGPSLRYVCFYPAVNSAAELVTGLCPERRFALSSCLTDLVPNRESLDLLFACMLDLPHKTWNYA